MRQKLFSNFFLILFFMEDISNKSKILKSLDILYIEDEINIQKELTKTLKLLCNKVHAFSNAEEAYDFFKENEIDIILSDVTLENMSGLEFSEKIRELDKNIPIIIISAHTDTDYLLKASKLKLVEYLVKPIDFKQLQTTLFNACNELKEKESNKIKFKNGIIYNLEKKIIIDKENIIKLTQNEIRFLNLLSKNSKPISSDEIKNEVWDDLYYATDLALKSLIHKLRKKIGKESIKNISGVGYYLE